MEPMRGRTFTTPAYFPREHPMSVRGPDDHLEIAYKIWDQPHVLDAPPQEERFNLLFVHGSQFIKEIWRYYAQLAFKEWGAKLDKIIAFDCATHGDSAYLNKEKVGYFSSWADVGRDGGQVIEACQKTGEIKGPLIVVGHSMGGAGTIFMANFHSSRISAIVVFDPIWGGLWAGIPKDQWASHKGLMASKVYKYAHDDFDTFEEYEKYMRTKYITKSFHPEIQSDMLHHFVYKDHFTGHYVVKSPKALQAGTYLSVESVVGYGRTLFLATRLPMMIVQGDISDWNMPGDMEELHKRIPHSKLATVPGGGHLIFFEKPDAIFAACKDFITEQANAALERRKVSYYDVTAPEFQNREVVKAFTNMIKESKL